MSKVFSQVKLIKTKQANKYLYEIVVSRLLTKQAIAEDGACYKFSPSKSMVDAIIEKRCWQRYANNMRFQNQESQLILNTCDLGDAIVNKDADSLTFFN